MIPLKTVKEDYFQSEGIKLSHGDIPVSRFPTVAGYIPLWNKEIFSADEVRRLDMFVTVNEGDEPDGGTQIFREILSTNAGEIADQLGYLRSLNDPYISKWVNGIGPGMSDSILNGTIPPLILIRPVGLEYGHIPDGNHRALSLLELSKQGYSGVSIPAYVGRLSYVRWLVWNTGVLLFKARINPKETAQLINARMKGGYRMFEYRSQFEPV